MSYGFTLNFIKVKDKTEAYNKAYEITEEQWKHRSKIIADNAFYAPSFRNIGELNKLADTFWVCSLFTTSFTYWEQYNLLAVIGDDRFFPEKMKVCTIYFQNSCDQDYNYKEWQNLCPEIDNIIKEVENMSIEHLLKVLDIDIEDMDADEISPDYYRSWLIYHRVFKLLNLEKWLYSPDSPENYQDVNFTRFALSPLFNSNRSAEIRQKTNLIINNKTEEISKEFGITFS